MVDTSKGDIAADRQESGKRIVSTSAASLRPLLRIIHAIFSFHHAIMLFAQIQQNEANYPLT